MSYMTRTCRIELAEVIDNDFEGFLDLISERAFGSPLLMDISYKVIAVREGDLILSVCGDTSEIDPKDIEP